jgi:hypothetical protein
MNGNNLVASPRSILASWWYISQQMNVHGVKKNEIRTAGPLLTEPRRRV